jgi:tetratricopeptide (TPR) repeat protein
MSEPAIRWIARNLTEVSREILGASAFFKLNRKRSQSVARIRRVARRGLSPAPPSAVDKIRHRRRQRLLFQLLWKKAAATAVDEAGKALAEESDTASVSTELLLLSCIGHYEKGALAELEAGLGVLAARRFSPALAPVFEALRILAIWLRGQEGSIDAEAERELAAYFASDPYPRLPMYLRADVLRMHIWLGKFRPVTLPSISAPTFRGARVFALRAAASDLMPSAPASARSLIETIRGRKQQAQAWIGVTKSLKRAWQLAAANDANYEAIAASEPYPAVAAAAWAQRAELLHLFRKPTDAAAAAAKALVLDPLNVEAALWSRIITGRPCAVQPMSLAMMVREEPARLRSALRAAQILEHAGRIPDAIELARLALENDVASGQGKEYDALVNYLGGLYAASADFHTALRLYETPVSPGSPSAEYARSTGVVRCLLEMGRLEEARTRFASARARLPAAAQEPRFDAISMEIALLEGRIGDAFGLYKLRKVSSDLRQVLPGIALPASVSIDSIPRESRVLVLNEWGPGDEIRLASLFDELADKFPNLTMTCEPRLISLHKRNFPNIRFVPVPRSRREYRHTSYEETSRVFSDSLAYFVTNEVMDLAREMDVVFSVYDALGEMRPNRAAFPQKRQYLSPDPDLSAEWAKRVAGVSGSKSGLLRVGLTWRSMLQSTARDRHYLDVTDLAPLAGIEGVEYWNLQTHLTDEERTYLNSILPSFHVADDLDLRDDFEGQAAFLSQMDVVIAPCTTMAEFAAALGCRTLFLSATYQTIWRRNADGSDVWHAPSRILTTDPMGNKAGLGRLAAQSIRDMI